MFCQNCGKKLPENARFCTSCGTRVEYVKTNVPEDAGEPTLQYRDVPEDAYGRPPKKKNVLMIIVVIILIIAAAVAVCFAALKHINGRTAVKDENRKTSQESEEEEEEKTTAKNKTEKDSVIKKKNKADESSQFKNKTRSAYFLCEDETELYLVNESGQLFSFGGDRNYPEFSQTIGDNGVLAGKFYTDNSTEILFIVKDGSFINICECPEDALSFCLSGSGEKLIYAIDEAGLYVYDTENGETKTLIESEKADYYVRKVSYHGNVVLLNNDYISISSIDKGKPFWGQPFARYLAAADDGSHIYYNSSYRTSSGARGEDGHYENEEYSVDFCEVSIPDDYDPEKDSSFPLSYTIMTSESIYAGILAHTADYSEILFGYDGDTYYYQDQEKTRLTTGALLVPVESLRPYDMNANSNFTDSIINLWNRADNEDSWNPDLEHILSSAGSLYDTTHGLESMKDRVYLQFSEGQGHNVSLIWLDEDLETTELIGNITGQPVLSKDGTKIWCLSGIKMYCMDLSEGEPDVHSAEVGETNYNYEALYPMPIAVGEDGETVYYLANFRINDPEKSNYVSSAEMYEMKLDKMDSPTLIDTKVLYLGDGPEGEICYLKEWDSEEQSGALYRYNEKDGSKEQIAKNVRDFRILNNSLFYMVKEEDSEDCSLRRQTTNGSSDLVLTKVRYIEDLFRF